MAVFACACCAATLTVPLSRVALPDHAIQRFGQNPLGLLMEPGTYAVNPDPWGPPLRSLDGLDPAVAESHGIFATQGSLPFGPRGAVVVALGDVRGTALIPERNAGGCCGLAGRDGPNLACVRCGKPVATLVDDCGAWQAVWLDPRAVTAVDGDEPPHRTLDWEALLVERTGEPPTEMDGWWSPLWRAAVAVALVRLLVVSAGARLTFPGGLLTVTFGRAMEILHPAGGPGKSVALAGPGLPALTADIGLVPRHPQTGEHWAPLGSPDVVPLAWDVWAHLALRRGRGPVRVPRWVHDDDPLPMNPDRRFEPDWAIFFRALARSPEVRQPWLNAIYQRSARNPIEPGFLAFSKLEH